MKYKTNWLGIILIAMALLVLGVVFILNLVREEQEFRGLKTLSVIQFNNDGNDVKPQGRMELESTVDFLTLELNGQTCRIAKPEGLVGAYQGGPYFCESDIPWAIYFGKHYDTIGIAELTHVLIHDDQRSFQYTGSYFLCFIQNESDKLNKQECIRRFKKLTSAPLWD